MMPNTSRPLLTSNVEPDWDTLMEVHYEPIEKNYELLEEIGKGQFAVVKKCRELKTGSVYAAKIMRKRRVARGVAAADIAREAGLLAQLRHPNIVSLHKVIDTGKTVVLILELISDGELFHWTPSSENEAAHVVRQVLMALRHLHSHQVAHLDIKPENILLSTPPPMPNIKLIDLGLSHRLMPGSELRALFGTPEFVAPEIVNYEPLSLGTDLWAIGVLTYILLSGASPFLGNSKQETYANVAACQYQFDDEFFSNISQLAKDFIRSLLVKDPKERGSADLCLNHPWILVDSETSQDYSRALISAVKRGCIQTVCQLLNQGIQVDIKDTKQDTLLHIACATGNEVMTALLIDNGIELDVANDKGHTPLHVAARNGHINIVRLLCLSGCDVDKTNHGIRADVTAIKYGHLDIANLLDKLRNGIQRENYIKQLQITHKPIDCLHIRILGHCATGKTSLINSLKAGIFSFGLFRRSKSQNCSTKRAPSIELDVTSKHGSLSFEYSDNEYEGTIGIEWSKANLGGECVFWELCGREDFLTSYHHVLSFQLSAVHLITISLREPLTVQLQQARFWLRFIMDRIPPDNIGFAGKFLDLKVILVGTYAPEPQAPNVNRTNFLAPLIPFLNEFKPILGDEPLMVALDATNCSNPGVKLLRSYLTNARAGFLEGVENRKITPTVVSQSVVSSKTTLQDLLRAIEAKNQIIAQLERRIEKIESRSDPSNRLVVQKPTTTSKPLVNTSIVRTRTTTEPADARSVLLNESAFVWTGLLEAWRAHMQTLEDPPVMLSFDELLIEVRKINPLASLDHCQYLAHQLQILGDLIILQGNLVILNPEWFWRDVIGWQLNPEQRSRLVRTTGVYTLEDFQARCPCPANQALRVLQITNFCVMCDIDDDEVEYEIPCLNFVERLRGLWEPWKPNSTSLPHTGLRLHLAEASFYHLIPLFPHLQVQLRKVTQSWDPHDSDLYQWWRGSKLCIGSCESIITLEEEDQGYIEIKVRGSPDSGSQCFALLGVIFDTIDATINIVAPALLLERHWLSPSQLRNYDEVIHSWEPAPILSALLEKNFDEVRFKNPFNGRQESIWEIVGCGSNLMDNCVPGTRQPVKYIKLGIQRKLAQMLDPPDPHGKDWCLLAVRLGLSDRVATLDSSVESPTLRLLACTGISCTVGSLIKQLQALGRDDAVHLLLSYSPVFVLSMSIESETGSNLSR